MPTVQKHILVVEDEPPQLELLSYNLGRENYRLSTATDGENGLVLAKEELPDLIILDWMLPYVSGIEVCRQLKKDKETARIPIILLTARGEESDKLRGLDTGADDYIVKPYSVNELLARVKTILRRYSAKAEDEILNFANITLDTATHRVMFHDKAISLGPTEYKLLEFLLEKPGRVWSREQLLDHVWGWEADINIRTVDVHIARLRKALKINGYKVPLRTIRSFGYALEEA